MKRAIIALSLLVASTVAFPSGAPPAACSTRTPNHGVVAQTTDCPYDFVALGWIPGAFTSMGIFPIVEGSDLKFKGFLASVDHNGSSIGEMKLGRPRDNDPTSSRLKLACDNTSLTHSDNANKSEIFFEWKAPRDLPLDAQVTLRLTIVQERTVFWVDCNTVSLGSLAVTSTTTSSTIREGTTGNLSSTSSSSSSTSSTTAAPIPAPATRAPQTPPPTTRAPTTQPRTTRAPTTRAPTTQRRTTRAPTTRAPTTRPPTTRAPAPHTYASRTRPPTTYRAPTTRRPRVPASANTDGSFDSYLDYQNKAKLNHETVSASVCREYGNEFTIVPNSSCRQFVQKIAGNNSANYRGYTINCPGGTRFDPRVCSCAFTTYCPLP